MALSKEGYNGPGRMKLESSTARFYQSGVTFVDTELCA